MFASGTCWKRKAGGRLTGTVDSMVRGKRLDGRTADVCPLNLRVAERQSSPAPVLTAPQHFFFFFLLISWDRGDWGTLQALTYLCRSLTPELLPPRENYSV